MATTNRPCTHHLPIWGSFHHFWPTTTTSQPPWHSLQHQAWAMRRHKHWPPPHHTHYYDPWPLPTGPAPTTFRSGEDRNHFCSMAPRIPMIDFEPSPQPPSTPPNPTHTPTYTHRVMLWTYVVGQTTWLWIITTTTAATEPNAMVNWMSLHTARG